MDLLRQYLEVAPHLTPHAAAGAVQSTIRHPDLQPSNVFVSKDLDITGIIDWQHSTILPLFLQAGIPSTLQNYGDDISEALIEPQVSADFDERDESEQLREVVLLRKRQLHYHYVMETKHLNTEHAEALLDPLSILRRKLFRRSSEPWEGDSSALHADLVQAVHLWPALSANDMQVKCPLTFSETEARGALHLATTMEAADAQMQSCLDVVGVGPESWVPHERYDEARQQAEQLKADTLEGAESPEERRQMADHWVLDDFDETDYM